MLGGLIFWIIVGAIAGFLAEKIMKADMGIFMNIIIGILGAVILNVILGFFGVNLYGWIGQSIVAIIGACILIAIYRAVAGRSHA